MCVLFYPSKGSVKALHQCPLDFLLNYCSTSKPNLVFRFWIGNPSFWNIFLMQSSPDSTLFWVVENPQNLSITCQVYFVCLHDPGIFVENNSIPKKDKTLINNFSQAGVEVRQVSADWRKKKIKDYVSDYGIREKNYHTEIRKTTQKETWEWVKYPQTILQKGKAKTLHLYWFTLWGMTPTLP